MRTMLAAFALLVAAGCSAAHTQARRAEDNRALMQKFVDRMNKHDLSAIDECFAADYVEHNAAPGMPPGRDGLKQMFQMYLKAFPDMSMKVEHVVSEGDLIVIHLTSMGTNKGEMMGMPATGKAVKVAEMHLARVRDGKFVGPRGKRKAAG